MKIGFKELGITPKCHRCGEPYNIVQDLSVNSYDIQDKNLHVCDPKKVEQQKIELKEVVKEVKKKQAEILKTKEINMEILTKPMDI